MSIYHSHPTSIHYSKKILFSSNFNPLKLLQPILAEISFVNFFHKIFPENFFFNKNCFAKFLFWKIYFLKIFFENFFCKFFLQNFFTNLYFAIFSKYFRKKVFKKNLKKFSKKIFQKIFFKKIEKIIWERVNSQHWASSQALSLHVSVIFRLSTFRKAMFPAFSHQSKHLNLQSLFLGNLPEVLLWS